eukprot:Skav222709  [mRNA]  locus=scaffold1661:97954:102885:+ [translate_table: standard]
MWTCLRVGEASHPGPNQTMQSYVIGCANPTGLLGKAHVASKLPGMQDQRGLWGFSETHLTKRGCEQFQRDLHFATQGKASFLAGHPADYLSQNTGSIGGDSKGVGFLASFPGRPLTHDWDEGIFASARVQVAAYQIGNIWCKCGLAYGFAFNSHIAKTKKQTNTLLASLSTRIVLQSSGPRCILGDWNLTSEDAEHATFWKEQGFFDVQSFAKWKWGRDIQPTYRNKSVIDHIWLSREFAPWIQDVCIDNTWFADHALLFVRLQMPRTRRPAEIWIKPHALPWDAVPDANECPVPSIDGLDVDQTFCTLMHSLEEHVDKALRQTGQPGLVPSQRGRACTTECKLVHSPAPPLKRSKNQDPVIGFVGENWQHFHWFRQLRRLTNLQRLLLSTRCSERIKEVKALWQSIIAAKGFGGGFRHYWFHRASQHAGCIRVLPKQCPTVDEVTGIVINFQKELKALESCLNQHRSAQAKASRIADPTKIFQDLKAPRPLPVQTLIMNTHTEAVDIDDRTITIAPNTLTPGEPVMKDHHVVATEWISDVQFTLHQDVVVDVGDTLHQQEFAADAKALFGQFEDMWMRRWDKHRFVSDETWTPFCNMVTSLVPKPDAYMEHHPISVEQWYAAVRAKKVKTACGPDGITRMDLLKCPKPITVQLLRMIESIESGQPWPRAAMIDLISTLEKVELAHSPNQFRPICVLSGFYRVWASIRTKQLIQWLSKLSPKGLFGNRKGCDTSQLWWNLSVQIETAILEGDPLSGSLGDIVKCFNTLPRIPVFHLLSHLNVPACLIKPWFSAVSQLERRFSILGEVGGGLRSTTGFPEGDPLSICAMMVINIAMDAFLTNEHPGISLLTYVDNIELVGADTQEVIASVDSLRSFCGMLDIELDQPKQMFWSTSPGGRKHLRDTDLVVTYHVRDLGGQMTYCRRHVNKVIQQRIKSMADHWHRMSRSAAPYHRKVQSLLAAAWPKALHGASIVKLGDTHVAKLRTGALKGLGCTNKGINPMLHLSLVHEAKTDPGFYLLWQTVYTFRRNSNPSQVWPILDHLSAQGMRQDPGPCAVLLQRLHSIAWAWHGEGWVTDHDGIRLNLHDSPIQLLKQRLQQAWQAMVATELSTTRSSFAGLQHVDPGFTMEDFEDHSLEDQALLRVVLNGSFYTRDNLVHSGKVETKQCPWCPCIDSVAHRHWSCPFMSEVWGSVEDGLADRVQSMENCTSMHGWFPQLTGSKQWLRSLAALPDRTWEWEVPQTLPAVLHIFTDGSAMYPSQPRIRLASWAFVIADLETDDFVPVARGLVHGILQTVLRGEILAALSALRFMIAMDRDGVLWADNALVVQRIAMYQSGEPPPNNLEPNHDLWADLYEAVHLAGRHLIKCVKVPSHENIDNYTDLIDRWALRGNAAADREATGARNDMPSELFHLWNDLVAEHQQQVHDKLQLHQHFLAVGKRAVMKGSTAPSAPNVDGDTDEEAQEISPVHERTHDDAEIPHVFCPMPEWEMRNESIALGPCGSEVFHWLHTLVNQDDSVTSWVSMYQLLISYQLHVGCWGPAKQGKFWIRSEEFWPQAFSYNFLKQSKFFTQYLKHLGRSFGLVITGSFRRPTCSELIPVWCRCYKMRVSRGMMVRVDECLKRFKSTPFTKMKRDFAMFPVAYDL